MSASSARTSFAGVTSSNCTLSAMLGRGLRHLARLLDRVLDGADHVEGGLGEVIVLAGANALEALDGVLEVDEDARAAGEDFGDVEGLAEEALDLTGAGD